MHIAFNAARMFVLLAALLDDAQDILFRRSSRTGSVGSFSGWR